jgi:AcrR family transcriptional regulator
MADLTFPPTVAQTEEERLARSPGRQGYHHGDARNALVVAAGELLEGVGAAGLSLRQVAERAALSRQAPYNHFADKEAPLAELARAGFEWLTAGVRRVTTGLSGEQALACAGEAYIGFAQGSPALFLLMFSRELVDLSRFPEAGAAAASFGALVAVVATMAPEDQVADRSLAAWCIVHGYATLCNETGLEPVSERSTRARQFARLFRQEPAATMSWRRTPALSRGWSKPAGSTPRSSRKMAGLSSSGCRGGSQPDAGGQAASMLSMKSRTAFANLSGASIAT